MAGTGSGTTRCCRQPHSRTGNQACRAGTPKPSLERCSKAISSSEEEFRWIDLRDVAVGSSMCLTTDEDRTAGITVTQVRDTDDTDYEDVSMTLRGLVWN